MLNTMKPALVLFIFTLVAGVCLGFVFDITKEPILQQEIRAKVTAMQQIFPATSEFQEQEIDLTERAGLDSVTECLNASGETIGFIIGASQSGYSGIIEVLVAINNEAAIEGIAIVKQSETPGLGANAVLPKFTNQYIGKAGQLSVTKSESPSDTEVQAITSSTITTVAVTDAVNNALNFFNSEIGGK